MEEALWALTQVKAGILSCVREWLPAAFLPSINVIILVSARVAASRFYNSSGYFTVSIYKQTRQMHADSSIFLPPDSQANQDHQRLLHGEAIACQTMTGSVFSLVIST